MPRRANLQVAIQPPPSLESDIQTENLAALRKQWRWAAFSQFFFTFSHLFAMTDVTIADVERDLTCNTRQVIPRVMQRLLYTLSYDRKVSVENWQTALRKQYYKRNPLANPIGREPIALTDLSNDEQEEVKEIHSEKDQDLANQHILSCSNDVEQNRTVSDISASAPVSPRSQDNASERTSQIPDLYSTRQSSMADQIIPPIKGSDGDPSLDWFDLPMLAKLESIHTLAEWQLQNPTRLRMIMKSDDETATWRVEPIGYDTKRNAYWFIGSDRLWIQRALPKAPGKKPLKRKRTTAKSSVKTKTTSAITRNAKRPRITPPEVKSKQQPIENPSSGRHSRAAKDQAKLKLDAQARELAELNRQAALTSPKKIPRQASMRSKVIQTPPKTIGTRASARIRGNPNTQDEEWQPVPEGWLEEGPSFISSRSSSRIAIKKTGLETDDGSVSDLTELSEDTPDPSISDNEKDHDEPGLEPEPQPDGFVEWETICVTLYEWEHISEQFEKATHYTEKALYKVLVNEIVPFVTEELREIERKRQAEEALIHRKRSSRLALRESEKEEARAAAVRNQEESEKMSRTRRLETRKQREEEDRLKKENDREQRRMARELREESRKTQIAAEEAKAKIEAERATKQRKSFSPVREPRKTKSQKISPAACSAGSTTPAGEDWELACEICQRHGMNLDDGTPMMSCGICSRWQHIQCHDRADRDAGRPRRNWKSEDFVCGRCRATQRMQYNEHPSLLARQPISLSKTLPPINSPQVQAYGAFQSIGPVAYTGSLDSRPLIPQPSAYRESYYPRPNGQQYQNPPPQYPPNPSAHPSLSFNQYQPQHNLGGMMAQKPLYTPAQSSYYRTPNPAVQPYPTTYRQDSSSDYYRSQQATNPSQAPGYSLAQNTQSAITAPSYRHTLANDSEVPLTNGHSTREAQTSYARYPAEQYPPSQYKQSSVGYPSSDR
ncbi:hypothetical protein CPB83DRAFT_405954 [Crepidotus variabilis]|uniref:PHD-type domain-containing protein n=1 Tax=Crepidotus variabilis TaxID=179855 RepID=A0A9P6JUR5_9AGAR|nr:hypothetical protein CPB83DRAFT_405954 [Crepidotus variabilis]